MSQFARFVLCLVAVSISNVNAEESNESGSTEELIMAMDECRTKFQIPKDDFEAVDKTGDVFKINPCFWGCYYTKIGLLNDKGQLDLDNFKTITRKFIKYADFFAKLEKMLKGCESVKDEAVTDGEAGCERGALLAACFKKNAERRNATPPPA